MPIIGVIASSGDRNVPDAPTIGTATNVGTGRAYNNGRADVTFTAPVYTGGTPITGYTVTSSPGGFTGTGASSPISVTGLQSGVAYTFTVTATNAVGTSAPSAASNSITATTVPQAPTIGTATDLGTGTSVSVAFTAGATGGSAITGFTATSSPGSITGTGGSSPITVSGLTSGTAYTFTVTATNANGTSAASAASNSVTPIVPGDWDYIAGSTATGVTSVTFSSLPSTYNTFIVQVAAISASVGFSFQALRMNGVTQYRQHRTYTYSPSSTVTYDGIGTSASTQLELFASYSNSPSFAYWIISNAQATGFKGATGLGSTWRSAALNLNNNTLATTDGSFVSGTTTAAVTSLTLLFDYPLSTNNIKVWGVK